MKKVYSFTNENLTCLQTLYNFANAKVLTVLGSGDQYFSSLLFGAKEIEVYDTNPLSWDYFVLKFYGIILLSYEEFFNYFVTNETDDERIFNRLKKYLPLETKKNLEEQLNTHKKMSNMLETVDIASICFDDGRIIPYLSRKEFYRLKDMLIKVQLPIFYNFNLKELPDILQGKYYDILLASNIFYWLYLCDENTHVSEFKKLLEKFNCPNIQAIYSSGIREDLKEVIISNDFQVEAVQSANDFKFASDYIISLKR